MHELGVPSGRRPADVLVCVSLGDGGLPEQAGAPPCRRHALDFAVVNPLGISNMGQAQGQVEPLATATAYAERKRNHNRTAQRCREEGIAFRPMVIEAQGGIEKTAAATFHLIALAVAAAEGKELATVKNEMLQRISLELVRSSVRAVLWRVPKPRASSGRAVAAAVLWTAAALSLPTT